MGYTSPYPSSRLPSRSASAEGHAASRQLQRALLCAAFVACSGLVLSVPGCTPRQAPPALASGERPVTGVPRFDQFFADVNSVLVTVQEGRHEEAEARGALARRVALPESAPLDVLGARLRERTARWAAEGLTLELDFTGIDDAEASEPPDANAEAAAEGEARASDAVSSDAVSADASSDAPAAVPPTATLRTPGREPEPRELRLLEAIAQAALSGATLYTDMGSVRRRIERLGREVAELEGQVETSTTDVVDRERVRAKLKEARELLPELDTQARQVWGSADGLIALLDEAANTVPVAPAKRRPVVPTKDNQPPRLVPRAEPRPAPAASIGATTPAPPPAAPAPAP